MVWWKAVTMSYSASGYKIVLCGDKKKINHIKSKQFDISMHIYVLLYNFTSPTHFQAHTSIFFRRTWGNISSFGCRRFRSCNRKIFWKSFSSMCCFSQLNSKKTVRFPSFSTEPFCVFQWHKASLCIVLMNTPPS